MTILFSDDFETGDFSKWDPPPGFDTGGDSSVIDDPTGDGHGKVFASAYDSSSGDYGRIFKTVGLPSVYYFKYDIYQSSGYIDAMLATQNARHLGAGGDIFDEAVVGFDTDIGGSPLARPVTWDTVGPTVTYTPVSVSENVWITARCDMDYGAGIATLTLDGAELLTADISGGDPSDNDLFVLGSQFSGVEAPFFVYFDNFEIGTPGGGGGTEGDGNINLNNLSYRLWEQGDI